jgi:Signal transduction histidine kinase
LSAVSGALHILARSEDEATRGEALAAGTRSVAAMSSMIRDLLEYTRTRLGKGIPIAPTAGNLELLCKAVVGELSIAYPQTAFRFESAGPLDGFFDAERLHQVVSNLLNNAVQHGRPNIPVSLVAQGSPGSLAFRVTNDGTPISPEHLASIFDPLVQIPTDGEERPRTTNLGLGLFIAREIVLAHGGTIEATSSARDGTTFSVMLPREAR